MGEHIAASGSYTETERTASTPMLCHLERGSCGYNQLVGILDPTIVFKQEEEPPYNTEDILMHPALLLPLSRLNHLVQAEWGGAFQRVIGNDGIPPGGSTKPIVLRSNLGYTGTEPRVQMLKNRQFVDAQVQVFAKHGGNQWTKLGEWQIARELLTQ